jgi:putative colanic acid biosynthesis acetyltransferase WcaF
LFANKRRRNDENKIKPENSMSSPTRRRERAVHNISAAEDDNPYHRASFSVGHRLARLLWQLVYLFLYRTSPRPMHGWRALLLRVFGAKLGPGCHFYPSGKVWAPWNLECEDCCTLGDEAEIYNPSHIYLESHCIVSQQAFICGATHDYNHPDFPMISYSMRLGAYSWICARASVSPGVNVGAGAVLGLGSVAYDDLEPWTVYSGVPAVKVKMRTAPAVTEQNS